MSNANYINLSDSSTSVSRFRSTPEPIDFIIEKLIPADTVGAIVSTGGVGKSTLAMQIAIQLASYSVTELPFLNEPDFSIKQSYKVLYLSSEDSDNILSHKVYYNVKHLVDFTGCKKDDLWDELEENLKIADLTGSACSLTSVERGTVKTTDFYSQVKEYIDDFRPQVVILDTRCRLFGGDENKNETVAQEVSYVEALVKSIKAMMIIVHHTPQGNPEKPRGATSFQDNVRWVISMSKNNYGNITVSNIKQNYAKPENPFTISRLDDAPYWFEVKERNSRKDISVIDQVIAIMLEKGNSGFSQQQIVVYVREKYPTLAKAKIMDAIKFGKDEGTILDTGHGNKMELSVVVDATESEE